MAVTKSKHIRWKMALEHGDISKIAKSTGLHRHTVRLAVRDGLATKHTERLIDEWFGLKKKKTA